MPRKKKEPPKEMINGYVVENWEVTTEPVAYTPGGDPFNPEKEEIGPYGDIRKRSNPKRTNGDREFEDKGSFHRRKKEGLEVITSTEAVAPKEVDPRLKEVDNRLPSQLPNGITPVPQDHRYHVFGRDQFQGPMEPPEVRTPQQSHFASKLSSPAAQEMAELRLKASEQQRELAALRAKARADAHRQDLLRRGL